MKKERILLLKPLTHAIHVTLLMVSFVSFSVYAEKTLAAGWNSFRGGEPGGRAVVSASRTTSPGMNVSFELPGFATKNVVRDFENWQSISFPNQHITDVIGAPALPLLREYFAIPRNATVKIEVTNVIFESYTNAKIEPFQRPAFEYEKPEEIPFSIQEKIYTTDAFYPTEWVSSTESVIMHGVKMGILQINPFRYNPVTGTMQVAAKITCKVTYDAGPIQTFPSHLKNTFKAFCLNFDFMEYRSVPTRSRMNGKRATDYLMICDSKFLNNSGVKNLVDLYAGQGYTVELKDASTLNNDDAIKDYIQGLYDEGELDYVLLIGDLPAIPCHKTRGTSDSWYARLDGSDYICDIGLGRMPASDEAELDQMITKTINFQTGVEPGEWRKKAVMVAHKEDYPDKYSGCLQTIIDHNFKTEAPDMERIFGGDGGTNAQVTSAWNEGCVVMNYRGHGSSTAWTGWSSSRASFSTASVISLKNGLKTPVVWNIACNNGELTKSSHCLAEAEMCHDEGAVACLGATAASQTGVNHKTNMGLFYGPWDDEVGIVGDIRNYADAYALQNSGSSANSNINMYIFFGDPLIDILNISSIPYISTSKPDSGAEVEQNTTCQIKWGDNIDGKIKIELYKGGSVAEVLAASVESNGLFEWDVTTAVATGSDYKIRVTSIDSSALFAETKGTFSITKEYIITEYPHIQNFDDLDTASYVLPKKWEQLSEEELEWTVWTGKTPTKYVDQGAATGPDNDKTTGSGNYIYVESSSSNNPDKKADFITSKFNLNNLNDAKLEFYYHMFSDNEGEDQMGDLYLDISVDGTWKEEVVHLTKDHGDEWLLQEVPLNNYTGERVIFRFRAVTGSGWASDICLDDIKISGNPTSISKLGTRLPSCFDLRLHGSKLHFQLPDNNNMPYPLSIKLYNLQGKVVRTLVKDNVAAGYHTVSLYKLSNKSLAVGTYLCRMETGNFSKTIKVIFKR